MNRNETQAEARAQCKYRMENHRRNNIKTHCCKPTPYPGGSSSGGDEKIKIGSPKVNISINKCTLYSQPNHLHGGIHYGMYG